jgi:acylphosphatase
MQPCLYTMFSYQYTIRLTGSFLRKGFGFSCMRAAYELNLTGSIFYESGESVQIELEGNEKSIEQLIGEWVNIDFIRHIRILGKSEILLTKNDFIMHNQLD